MSFGLLVRKECWSLTLKGRLVVLAFAALFGTALVYGTYPFLAVTHPVGADFIVLEGWTASHPGVLKETALDFQRGAYKRILVLQASPAGEEEETPDFRFDPSGVLVKYGVPPEAVTYLRYPASQRDRTFHAALATRDWFNRQNLSSISFDVATIGPHARRSRLTFQRTFGGTARIGVIALNDRLYDARHWWRTSEGFREVQGEALAYIYAFRYVFCGNNG